MNALWCSRRNSCITIDSVYASSPVEQPADHIFGIVTFRDASVGSTVRIITLKCSFSLKKCVRFVVSTSIIETSSSSASVSFENTYDRYSLYECISSALSRLVSRACIIVFFVSGILIPTLCSMYVETLWNCTSVIGSGCKKSDDTNVGDGDI